jgi:hypothetical protein
LKTLRNSGDFQTEYEGSILFPLHHSKFIQDIAEIVSQDDTPQAPVVAHTSNALLLGEKLTSISGRF